MRQVPVEIGGRYGRLRVLHAAGSTSRGRMFNCRCSCGTLVAASASQLVRGTVRSCGCLRREHGYAIGSASKSDEHRARIGAANKARLERERRLREAQAADAAPGSSGYCDRPARPLRPKREAALALAAALGLAPRRT